MVKYLKFISVLIILLGWHLCGYGQFDPNIPSGTFPTGSDVNGNSNEGSSLDIICTSCAPPNEVTQTFTVSAVDDGTSDPDLAYFEWVIYGGVITSFSGVEQSGTVVDVGPPSYVYIRTRGIDGGNSWIDVQLNTALPETICCSPFLTLAIGLLRALYPAILSSLVYWES